MAAHTDEQFQQFLRTLTATNQSLDFFCDFDKINENVLAIKVKLCTLNALLGVSDLRAAVQAVWDQSPKVFEVLPILLAVREKETNVRITLSHSEPMSSFFKSVDKVVEFLNGTHLNNVFQSKKITNLVDYVFGIETGLDTNARKNRSGKIMEADIAGLFKSHGLQFKMQYSSKDIPAIQAVLGKDTKVFDFMIKANGTTYLIETNFYSGGGSKLNEVARSYIEVSQKVNSVSGFKFVWITDGAGWHSAKSKLAEAYRSIPYVYNFANIDEFIAMVK